ncbi:MetQ/NlpA family ABC transporter substrate-binding protein [Streptomyces durbertensis]|uniref:Lipoprotein n=1 Tax=Streptomyces durbertensis TaxID=2448886 RepID=A0ABR6EH78_9ACTN|nr:MetQ/NlpA family ABC transporter substrate-binding protein [Streptomyces durbertensis]MBB1244675.1 MetQ/NlpA family ABC transporter substrate-binding protein [Streptomyces durbertensis]
MRTHTRTTVLAATAAALTLALTACGTASDPDTGAATDTSKPLTVGASATPHAGILEYVRDNLAEDADLKLKIKVFDDYRLPNTAVQDGQVGANFFQHKPFLDDYNKQNGDTLVPVVNVHLEPLALYSKSVKDVKDLKAGHTVAVPNDATNEGRALKLLADHGLITLKDGVGTGATLADVTDPKGLKFKELEAATLPRSLGDVDAAVINGNYAIEAKLKPAEDALVVEKTEGNPYANLLAVKKGGEKDPRVVKLAELLNSDKVRSYLEKTYDDGSVIPAFGPVGS